MLLLKTPIVSVIIATYNSEKTLPLALASIEKQNYPKEKLEIFVIDGGSTDNTIQIAKRHECKVLNNLKREPIAAKYLGLRSASGEYIVYLDSDEVMESEDCIQRKINIFKTNDQIKAVIPSGYKKPLGYSDVNYYINEFGDPFSFFIYNLSKDANFFIETLKQKYIIVSENKDALVLDFGKTNPLPLIELVAMGSMLDLEYLRSIFPINNESLVPFYFYFLMRNKSLVAVMKNDNITHYSSETFFRYLKKVSSRVKNNIYNTSMGEGGFAGRSEFYPLWFRLKKYLFIPYSFFLILPLFDSLYLVATRKKIIYLLHLPLCLFTLILIVYYFLLKTLNITPTIKGYGQ